MIANATSKLVEPNRSSVDDRIARLAPNLVVIGHHQVNNGRNQKTQDVRSVPDLIPVNPAIPGRTAVHDLISQGI